MNQKSGTEKTMETTENHPEKETNKTTQEVEKPVHNLNTNSTPNDRMVKIKGCLSLLKMV